VLVPLFHHLLGDRMQHTECLSPCEVLNHVSGFRPPLLAGAFIRDIADRPSPRSVGLIHYLFTISTELVCVSGVGCKPASPHPAFQRGIDYLLAGDLTQSYCLLPSPTAPRGEAQTCLIYPCGWERVGATSLWAGAL